MPTVPVVPVGAGAPAAAPLPEYREVPITYEQNSVLNFINSNDRISSIWLQL